MNGKDEIRSQKAAAILANRIIGTIYDSSDPFTFIIRGQLLVDAFVTAIIEGSFLKPDKLNLDRFTYNTKISLCVAAGLVHDEVLPALQKLGKIRNRFAHRLWLSFEMKEADDFINTLKQSIILGNRLTELQAKKGSSILQQAIYVTCMYLFEQMVRITSTKSILDEFWAKTVDDHTMKNSSMVFSRIIGPLSESETGELLDRDELTKLRVSQEEQ